MVIVRAVHSDQIGRKCDQILPMRSFLNMHSPFVTEKFAIELVAKKQYCDHHKSVKATNKSVSWLFEQASLKIKKKQQQKTQNLFQDPFP